jgi:hypothetical protein
MEIHRQFPKTLPCCFALSRASGSGRISTGITFQKRSNPAVRLSQ